MCVCVCVLTDTGILGGVCNPVPVVLAALAQASDNLAPSWLHPTTVLVLCVVVAIACAVGSAVGAGQLADAEAVPCLASIAFAFAVHTALQVVSCA